MSAAKQLVDMRFLRTLVPLGELSDAQLQQLMGSYSVELIPSGTELFCKGDQDSSTFYLLSGQVQLIFTDGVEKIIRSQTAQSRYILVPERPRSASATTLSTTTILKIDKGVLDDIISSKESPGVEVKELEPGNQNDWMTRYLQSKVFLKLRAQNIQALMMRLEEVPVKAGQVIIRQNDDDGYYYIIKQGHCKVMRRNSPYEEEIEQAQLTVGTGFGEEAIISQNRRGATVAMIDDGVLMRLSREDFCRILVEPLIKDVIYRESLNMENVVYLDVRHYDDYVKDGLTDSINITLFELRSHIENLDTGKTYVAYSNHGHRAAAAAYLLCQQGLEGIILRSGLDGVPVDVARGNKPEVDADNIPVVDNVISFNNSKQFMTTPRGLSKRSEIKVESSESAKFHTDQVLQDPRVQALLQHASNNVLLGEEQELLADVARQKAEHEVLRLKMEAKLAKRSAEQARRKAEKHALESAEKADQVAREEAARLRELELGAKQAEVEEAMRQADEEAVRAQDAEIARLKAENDNSLLKQRLELAILSAQEEADRSANSLREFSAREEERQQAEEQAKQELERASNKEIESARILAQREIDILKSEIEYTRVSMQQKTDFETQKARDEAKARAEEVAQQKLDAIQAELQKTKELGEQKLNETLRLEAEKRQVAEHQVHLSLQEEMQQMSAVADQQSERARKAEQENQRAEVELQKIKRDMEEVRKHHHKASILAAEQARQEAIQEAYKESEKALFEKEKEITSAITFAEECSLRARAAEAARDSAVEETKNLQGDVANTQQQLQADISQDIARSEIEHEVARARAVELANKQAEIEDIRIHAEEVADRAKETELAKQNAESEVGKLKAEIKRFRAEHQNSSDASSNDQLQRQTDHDDEVRRKQDEIEQAARKAEQEIERARLAGIAHQQAQKEIQHLKTEVEIATLQASAQLESDKERSVAQQLEVEQKTEALAEKQQQVMSAIERAQSEKRRAKEADCARLEAERALESYREDAEQHEKIQREISKVRAESISKHVAMEAAAKRACKEAARAEQAERARGEAELEIVRLKKLASVQHRKAERAIRQSLDVVNKPAKKIMKSPNTDKNKQSDHSELPEKATLPKSEWVSDHIMWETTLGLRDDRDVSALVTPEEKEAVDDSTPWAEQLLTNISVPTLKKSEPEPPSLHDKNMLLNRTKFNVREVNQTLTPQLDSGSYIKRNHAVKKPVAPLIVVVAIVMLVAMYFAMNGSQRSDFNSSVKDIVSGKNDKKQKTVTAPNVSTKEKVVQQKQADSIEQRLEKRRTRIRKSLQRKEKLEERELQRSIKKQENNYQQKRKVMSKINTLVPDAISSDEKLDQAIDLISETPAKTSIIKSTVIDQYSTSEIIALDAGKFMKNGRSRATPQSALETQQDLLLDSGTTIDIDNSDREIKTFSTQETQDQRGNSEVEIEDVF